MNKYYIEENDEYLIDFDNCEKNIKDLLTFFLYKTYKSSNLFISIFTSFYDEIFENIAEAYDLNNTKNSLCISTKNDNKDSFKLFNEYGLNEKNIDLKYKKFLLFSDYKDKENNNIKSYLCMMGHLKNSIAHGHIYLSSIGRRKIFLFVDYNFNNNCTSKIVCTQTDLSDGNKSLVSIFKNLIFLYKLLHVFIYSGHKFFLFQ